MTAASTETDLRDARDVELSAVVTVHERGQASLHRGDEHGDIETLMVRHVMDQMGVCLTPL